MSTKDSGGDVQIRRRQAMFINVCDSIGTDATECRIRLGGLIQPQQHQRRATNNLPLAIRREIAHDELFDPGL